MKREDLHLALKEVCDSYAMNLYFEPPASMRIDYPCVIYEFAYPDTTRADNTSYLNKQKFQVSVITKQADTDAHYAIVKTIDNSRFRDIRVEDGLYHFIIDVTIIIDI